MTTPATAKQIDYILSLYNREHGTSYGHLSQIPRTDVPVSNTALRRLSKPEASAWIDSLLRK